MQYTQQQEPLKTTITIKSIMPSDKVPLYNVETVEGGKYQFWKNKADGQPTMAATQYDKFNFRGGDKVEIYYKEAEGRPYLNSHTGKMTTPINRTITKFVMEDGNTPSRATQSPMTQSQSAPNTVVTEQSSHPAMTDTSKELEKIWKSINDISFAIAHWNKMLQELEKKINFITGDDIPAPIEAPDDINIDEVPF